MAMSLKKIAKNLEGRLAEGDRGDRGWFIITRVHVELQWLKDIANYLYDRAGGHAISLTGLDYERLGDLVGISSSDPGMQLRRHHLLVMDKPLQLICRTQKSSWSEIRLTKQGVDLARSADSAAVLEQSLSKIKFAVEPWSPPDRVEQYSAFNVSVYLATKAVLEACGGCLHRDEYDFFVSRIRTSDEIPVAIKGILEFRKLSSDEQNSLHQLVLNRIDGKKSYSNWRDQALHTFSLFSLGTSMIRKGHRLLLTANWVREEKPIEVIAPEELPDEEETAPQSGALKIPLPPQSDELLLPPAPTEGNVGAEAESFVAKILGSQGWSISFYTNKRGYGFDLWARKDDRAMVVEVKSSISSLGQVSLTVNEYNAAQLYKDNYYLALVENIGSDSPKILLIQNPAKILEFKAQQSLSYVVSEKSWRAAVNK